MARFVDLENRIGKLPTKQERGEAFEVFVEAFLSTQPLYQAKIIWPFSAIPLSIRDRFALARREVGVDGVFEAHLGEYHAYQAKFRTGRPSLTWDELSTFLGLTDQIAERVVITNCDELSSVVSDRRGFYAIRGTDLDRLQSDDFEAIRKWLAGASVERKHKMPLPRQEEALVGVLGTLKQHDRATLLMPCGTGKTLVALWAAEQLGSRTILVLVPSLALVSQTLHTWLKETRWENPSFLCVCSDPTVTRGVDALILHQGDVDFPVSTDSDSVRTFLERKTDGVKVICSTYQSARVVAAGMGNLKRFDLGIFDEAHRTAGYEGSHFSFALQDTNLSISKRLFMTATPRHYMRRPHNGGEASLVYSMDAPTVYGPVAYRLSFAQAVKANMICDYKVLISVITSEAVNAEMLRNAQVYIEGNAIQARQVANQLAMKNAFEKHNIGKVITFHKSVADAATFTVSGPGGVGAHVPGLATFHVNGGMPSGKREPILRAFADGDRALISNARCLTEGVDVPAVDMVAFLSPRRSRIDIVQATGRAMRKNDATQKAYGHVLLPLFLDEQKGERLEEAVARADFDEIWAVLQALQEHDEVLGEVIAELKEMGDTMVGSVNRLFSEKMEILPPQLSLEALRKSIATKLLEGLISVGGSWAWESMFHALDKFRTQHGHCNVTLRHDVDLAFWVMRQRESKLRGSLSHDKIRRLETIGLEWEPRDAEWEAMFEALNQFKQQFGHCNVPRNSSANRKLEMWCVRQRMRKRILTIDQLSRLNDLGFQWDSWEAMFSTLLEFRQQFGHCNVSYKTSPKLAAWIWKQCRDRYQGLLPNDKLCRLDEIGVYWRSPKPRKVITKPVDRKLYWETVLNRTINDIPTAEWDAMFDALVRYKQRYGHCNVGPKASEFAELAGWIDRQRLVHEAGGLSKDRQQRLEDLGFDFELRQQWVKTQSKTWDDNFSALGEFKATHGHCNVPQEWPENPSLSDWVRRQRERQRAGRLREEHQQRLDAIGFEWNLRTPKKELLPNKLLHPDQHVQKEDYLPGDEAAHGDHSG